MNRLYAAIELHSNNSGPVATPQLDPGCPLHNHRSARSDKSSKIPRSPLENSRAQRNQATDCSIGSS